jgi:anti-sigma factor RsiW
MMAIDHDALREASGLYVLGALAGDDRAAFEAHLAGCPECTAEVRALRDVADALSYGIAC